MERSQDFESECIGSVFELLGDMITYKVEDFERIEPTNYCAVENIFLMGFAQTEYDDDTEFAITVGEAFEVVGISGNNDMYMIFYKGQLFCCDKAEIEFTSQKLN